MRALLVLFVAAALAGCLGGPGAADADSLNITDVEPVLYREDPHLRVSFNATLDLNASDVVLHRPTGTAANATAVRDGVAYLELVPGERYDIPGQPHAMDIPPGGTYRIVVAAEGVRSVRNVTYEGADPVIADASMATTGNGSRRLFHGFNVTVVNRGDLPAFIYKLWATIPGLTRIAFGVAAPVSGANEVVLLPRDREEGEELFGSFPYSFTASFKYRNGTEFGVYEETFDR